MPASSAQPLPVVGAHAEGRFARAEPDVLLAHGFHQMESDAVGSWVLPESAVTFAAADRVRFLDFWVFSEFFDLSQTISMASAGNAVRYRVPRGWSPLSVEIPAGAGRTTFAVNKSLPAAHHPADPRELAVRLRGFQLHPDRTRHDRVLSRQANMVANLADMLAGRAAIASTPPSLGIDMYGACNIKPPCVYCAWDSSKLDEGEFVDAPFTVDTLRDWGPLFEQSTSLVNCSIGEPFMMKNIEELLDTFADAGKMLELSTNGQILTDTNIRKLLGRPINLYISLDAATPATYATLRNDRFDLLVANVRRLIDAKGGPGRLPVVNLVFMPMRANLHELDRFVGLCADLRADYLALRPLNYAEASALNWTRAGYRFEYDKELLPWDQLVRASGRAAGLCERAGVTLSDQMDFGGSFSAQFLALHEEGRRSVEAAGTPPPGASAPAMAAPAPAAPHAPAPTLGAEKLPACTEPWKSLYVLRRGIFPCCYGGKALAPMNRYREALASPLLHDIRRELARGKFHQYCLESPACPIVRKSQASGELESKLGRRRRWAATVRRHWRRLVWAGQWSRIRARRIVTEPGYVRKQIGRVMGRPSK